MRIGLAGVGRIGAFHARTLAALDDVDELVVTDADRQAAERVAAELGLQMAGRVAAGLRIQVAPDADALIASGVDGFVIATATPGHAPLLRRAVAAGMPVFCEKPVAATLKETIELADLAETSQVPIHVGFQRRFDAGYLRARAAVASGELGFVHTIRAGTHDQAPPHASYVPTSGGIFRDCNVHDFDILRFVTGREVATVYATGANKGAAFFAEAGDVDTGGALLTLDDGTIALISSTRYNGGGHDVRMEVHGEKGTIAVGLDHSLAMRSAEEGVDFPRGPRKWSFMERFLPAYQAELAAFAAVARGERPSPCTVRDALEAFRVAEACELSQTERRPVALSEIEGIGGGA
ncbi:Gfo/Idh/MocA family oxidoreductase [Nonomuraea sp. SMC257]|uniref:Gfo/Idh/MocA family oxidoreductase n=1 Tax=Nonomuraea montanisoli TaxID=2741721 RepID=A0A7Y6I1F9_9ACTN|nr:Gfo/Idh/MocA family oxidoreductase [Nonomuraea montanisoli]NUW29947.1 Gfo/Idh/MocA family oxidoreductase [Nonomuraea montanisoli]